MFVRRVTAVEGDILVSSEDPPQEVTVGPGEMWVQVDKEGGGGETGADSTSFGPITMAAVTGRVVVAWPEDTPDASRLVVNSPQSSRDDNVWMGKKQEAALELLRQKAMSQGGKSDGK